MNKNKKNLISDDKYLKNPGRGWYRIFPFDIEKNIDFKELYWCLRDDETLVLLMLNIGAYKNRDIDSEALERVQKLFDFFKENKKEIILRIVYDRTGNGMENEPDNIDIIISHMRQVGVIVKSYEDIIYVCQGVFVGSWGEMHTTRYVAEKNIRRLYDEWSKYAGDYIAVRTLKQLLWFMDGCHKARCTLFNDGLFGSATHMGTISENTGDVEEIRKYCEILPVGGEAITNQTGDNDFSKEQTIETLEKFHIAYLNSTYDEKRVSKWKNDGIYDEITKRMGYCFVLKNVSAGRKKICFEIENTGFGVCPFEIDILLQTENDTIKVYEIKDELWAAGVKKKFLYESEKKNDMCAHKEKIYICIKRRRDNASVYFLNQSDEMGRIYTGRLTLW